MFSFIIPCFNGKAALENTLKSFAWQEADVPFEVILVDNNSDRENLDELYEAYKNSLNLYLIKQPKLETTYALCKARNVGLKIASYPWIITLDSDIILPPHYTSVLSQSLEGQSHVIFTAERLFVTRQSVEPLTIESMQKAAPIASVSNYNQTEDRRLPYLKNLENTEQPWSFFHGCNTIFMREDALKVGGFNEAYDGYWGYEDIDFAHRLIVGAHCAPEYIPELYVFHQEEEGEVAHLAERFDKSKNPNWKRICDSIPGFKEFKNRHYQSLLTEEICLDE